MWGLHAYIANTLSRLSSSATIVIQCDCELTRSLIICSTQPYEAQGISNSRCVNGIFSHSFTLLWVQWMDGIFNLCVYIHSAKTKWESEISMKYIIYTICTLHKYIYSLILWNTFFSIMRICLSKHIYDNSATGSFIAFEFKFYIWLNTENFANRHWFFVHCQ